MRKTLFACALATQVLVMVAQADEASQQPEITAPLGNAISYQGKLDKNGVPVNGNCNFVFKLFNALSGPAQIGVTVTLSNQPATSGLFSVALDFGAGAFDGQARWLEIQVQGPGDAGFTTLAPRAAINAAPYALHALSAPGSGSQWTNSNGDLTYSGGGVGVTGFSSPYSGKGVFFEGGLSGFADIFAYDYTASPPVAQNLLLQTNVDGNVGVGTFAPLGKFHSESSTNTAVIGKHTGNWVGVYGESQTSAGVWGNSAIGVGVQGSTASTASAGVYGYATDVNGWGGVFRNLAGGVALFSDGKAVVKTLQILGGADIVEGFETGDDVLEPGTVVVIDERHAGELRASAHAYDSRVAGVVSGAGGIAPGLQLGQEGVMDGETPVAMSGRVYVRSTAANGRIRPGDLLTTSDVAGLAMRATDTERSHGAVVGKAMTSLDAGTGLVLVLVNLH